MECVRCKVEMDPGFIPDFGTAATWIAVWVGGAPNAQKSTWERMKTGAGVGLGEAEAKAIEAHRCPKCCRLELFAIHAPELGSTPAARR